MSNSEQHFRVLNLDPTATPEQVYQAYRDLARVWDPQRFSHSPRLEMMAEAKLEEIIAAYHALQPSGFPGGSPRSGSAAVETSALPLPADEPAHPLAPADPFAAPVADLHRPVELGSIPAPLPRPPAVTPSNRLLRSSRAAGSGCLYRSSRPGPQNRQGPWRQTGIRGFPLRIRPRRSSPRTMHPACPRSPQPQPHQTLCRRNPEGLRWLSWLPPAFCSWGQEYSFVRSCRARLVELLYLPPSRPKRFRWMTPRLAPPLRR